jgi:Xaa-Pro aminopeptidase
MKNKPNFEDEFSYEIEATAAEISINAMDAVTEALEGADIDLQARKIIWSDGKSLTIEQSAQKISMQTGADIVAIMSHIICWLTMDFVPKGLNQEQMSSFEDKMDEWVKDYDSGF